LIALAAKNSSTAGASVHSLIEQAAQFRRERARSALAPQNVERPILCGG
jgi:hypothetical protein